MSEIAKKLVVSASPHFRSRTTTTTIMLDVIIAMIPALVASVILFGYRSLVLTVVSVISCVVFEYLSRKVMKRHNTIGDLSAVVTGMLLAFNLPSTMPYWMVIIGAFTAIVIAKQFFGGIGNNFVNPALIGRIVLMASYPSQIGNFVAPFSYKGEVDAMTTATPLAQMTSVYSAENIDVAIDGAGLPSLLDMFLGNRSGTIGETCAIALLLGGIYLIARKVIRWHTPVIFIGTVFVLSLIIKQDLTLALYEVLGGGLLYHVRNAAAHRPRGHVAPVVVRRQHLIRVEELAVDVVEVEVPVLAGARPVHDALRLVGRVVELVDAERVGDSSPDCHVLLRVDISRERNDQAEARALWRVFVCRVDCPRVAVEELPVCPELTVCEVRIEAEDRAEADIRAASFVAETSQECTDVLDVTLLLFSHRSVLGEGLRGACGRLETVKKLRPQDCLVLPLLRPSVVTEGDVERSVILYLHGVRLPS